MTIFWFRRDLRLDDNVGLFHALNSDEEVLPIFIFDDYILYKLPKDDARVTFIHELLSNLQKQLEEKGKSLAVFHGNPFDVFQKLLIENNISAVYSNHDYEPYARKRDKEIYQLFKERAIEFKTSKDQVIFEKSEVVKEDGLPYVVYTPYSRKWKEKFKTIQLVHYDSEKKLDKIANHAYPFLSLNDIGFEPSTIKVSPFDISDKLISNYEATRNFPDVNGTSMLGAYLRFGALSIRKMVTKAIESKNETFWNELIWREFFMQILWHFPHTINKSFKEKYDRIEWNNNEDDFKNWCEGKTGYPMVDAGMRELNETGFMHNRVRMVTASFLTKHLLIDWRWGEAYFARKLLDFDLASNNGGWQWAAGSGCDAAPYFRVFSPDAQTLKFDPKANYIRQWVPEYQNLNYRPMVDHKMARERALATYGKALKAS
jgi:deoxyribodipyrimidine photo-lyase